MVSMSVEFILDSLIIMRSCTIFGILIDDTSYIAECT